MDAICGILGKRDATAVRAMARAMAASAQEGGLDLKPEDITIEARVHARFAAS